MSDDQYRYPPELLELLIDTIPLLSRSKLGVLDLFRGCGVPEELLADLRRRVAAEPESIKKYVIARTVLSRINERGDSAVALRHEVVRRVIEFEDFSTCWPDDRDRAELQVGRVRRAVQARQAITRPGQGEERRALRERLAALPGMADPRQRGVAFEALLNDIFRLDGLSVREAFTLQSPSGQVGEQVDGLVVLDGHPILVEAKWRAGRLGVEDVSRHLVRVYSRPPGVLGLIVSASGFAPTAVEECRRALAQRVIMLAEADELLTLLGSPGASLAAWLSAKLLAASVDRQPLFRPPIASDRPGQLGFRGLRHARAVA